MRRSDVLLLLICLSIFSGVVPAEAHRVNVFAYVEGSTCHVEGYFSRSRRAKNATVEVFDAGGKKVLEGKTDDEGNFSFPVTSRGALRIVLTAGLGHKSEFLLPAAETESASDAPPTAEEVPSGVPVSTGKISGNKPPVVDAETIKGIIDDVLDERLKPVYALVSEIEEERNRIGAKEVISGLCYIAGVFGIAFFIAARRKER